jgi:hypothetical protein
MKEEGYVFDGHGGWRRIHWREDAKKKKKQDKLSKDK